MLESCPASGGLKKMNVARERVTYYDHLLPLHKRQCLVTILTCHPYIHPFSFHEMIFILVYKHNNCIPTF